MTRQENLIYRKQCPYDAMGDYSVLSETLNTFFNIFSKLLISPQSLILCGL